MSLTLTQWAIRNRVSAQALDELRAIFAPACDAPVSSSLPPESEAAVQARVRLEAAHKGLRLWRNNVGALLDSRGVPVRYGLANDSPALNKVLKSGDLIGWRTLTITPEHVGSKLAQFVSRECKRPDWRYTGTEHELAQQRWLQMVLGAGGDACFCSGEGTL